MPPLEIYLLLLADCFMDALIVPPHKAYVLSTLMDYGYSPWLLLICAIAGGTLGSLANAIIGRIVSTCRIKGLSAEGKYKPGIVETIEQLAARYGFFILLLTVWIPVFGAAFPTVAGFFRVRFRVALLSSLISFTAYFGYVIFTGASI